MVQGLVTQARRRLITGLLKMQLDQYDEVKGQSLPVIDWERLYDNPANIIFLVLGVHYRFWGMGK
jgi:hypothetical protein